MNQKKREALEKKIEISESEDESEEDDPFNPKH
jgi:hypothetical protein